MGRTNQFQSTRPSRASTKFGDVLLHTGLYFNPQGPRGPRPFRIPWIDDNGAISIHKALAGLDHLAVPGLAASVISIHKALAGLDFNPLNCSGSIVFISIHKALAGLDSKTIQQSLHIPLTFYALCPPLLISTSSIHSPSLFSRLFLCFSGANLPDISC